jgi:cell division protein FtsA
MEESAAIHAGLDIGTRKICAVVGEVRPRCTIKILGTSLTETKGVIQGEIFN